MKERVQTTEHNSIVTIEFATEKSNSLPLSILEALAQAIMEQKDRPEVKAIILSSAGEKAFCAGASFDELIEIQELERSTKFFGGFSQVLSAMRKCGKIVIVRVQGKTTGGGVGIACAADYCFATSAASLALTEINLGIGPFVIGPYVERKIGKSQFSAMALDGEFRNAEWAMQHNIYHRVFESIQDMDRGLSEFTSSITKKSAKALELIKKVSWEGTEHFDSLMPERIHMSASLILEDSAKENIEKIKKRLKK